MTNIKLHFIEELLMLARYFGTQNDTQHNMIFFWNLLKKIFRMSENAGEYGISDFIAARIDAHQKHNWMLRASLK